VFLQKKFLPIISLCGAPRHRDLSLAAATTATATAFAIFSTTGIDHVQFFHGIHLLSYRRLSINFGKKIGKQRASALQLY
jgi:hypothetical protein